MTDKKEKKLLGKAFAFLWLSETSFDFGSALMGFALGVWVFQTTGSAEQFAWTILSAAVPALLVTPFAGALADRYDRRLVIAGCDVSAALLVVGLAMLLFFDQLVVEHLYVFNAITSIVGTIRNPSYQAAVGAIVPKEKLTQANGMIGFTDGILQIGGPLMAGYLMASIGLEGIMVIEVCAVTAGAICVFTALSHARHAIRGEKPEETANVVRNVLDSWRSALGYFNAHRLMIGLVLYAVLQESLLVLVSAMVTPLVLSTETSDVLGLIMTAGAVGGLVGSISMMVLNLKKHLMMWVLLTDAALSAAICVAGFTTSPVWWGVCAFVAMGAGAASGTCAGALWMRKTPEGKRGSIFALLGGLDLLALCAVMLVGGSIGEHVFEPALAVGGAWAETIGTYVGSGQGRGYGFLFVVSGGLCTLISLVALFSPRLRKLDALVQDHDEKGEDDEELSGATSDPVLTGIPVTAKPAPTSS
ncbi:MFS transporter [Denitromonas iodatirespirans]|uniref:MFS transporter n=1 Tax=Denitromonas iodatirespirans TaxID=2795389 RepID=A0A944DCI0_DENI1|nr:MFS transporter [Denitromonas iodatirespirans]MBT0963974.1 MFS transporter [Denitromonas iodatirespirans]